ncbi:hypothetical protein CW304_12785 [Bacillus sp. UFRGS-B20]|nr:hypothetical protein CW304_12785 [Bacillus sp. UFRGS-B20]
MLCQLLHTSEVQLAANHQLRACFNLVIQTLPGPNTNFFAPAHPAFVILLPHFWKFNVSSITKLFW